MAAIASLSDALNRATGGAGASEQLHFFKDARVQAAAAVNTVTGRWTSLFQYNGHPAGAAAGPGAAANPTRATVGGLLQANPGGGRQKWITGFAAVANVAGSLMLYDRLLHCSGLDGTVATAQTVGGAVTRYTGAASVGNQIWIEIYTIIGVTGRTITASYTNQDGTSGQTTVAAVFGGSGFREAQRILQLPLAAGDNGVRSVESVTISASTGTAGDFGVTIARPLLFAPCDATGVGTVRDTLSSIPGPPEVLTDACLAMAWEAFATSPPTLIGGLYSVEA